MAPYRKKNRALLLYFDNANILRPTTAPGEMGRIAAIARNRHQLSERWDVFSKCDGTFLSNLVVTQIKLSERWDV